MAGAGLLLSWERVRTYPFLRTFPVLGAKNAEREASHSWLGRLTLPLAGKSSSVSVQWN